MIKINDVTYSGSIVPSHDDNKINVMLNTVSTIQDLSIALDNADKIIEIDFSGAETEYTVNNIMSISRVADNVFLATYSTKMTVIQEMSNAIDSLLVMVLEG